MKKIIFWAITAFLMMVSCPRDEAGKINNNSCIPLTLSRRFSMTEVKAKNENPAYAVKIKGVRIGRAVSKRTFDFSANPGTNPYESWTPGSYTADYTIRYAEGRTLKSSAISLMDTVGSNPKNTAMLIPQTLTAWDRENDTGNNNNNGAFLSVWVNIKQNGTIPHSAVISQITRRQLRLDCNSHRNGMESGQEICLHA